MRIIIAGGSCADIDRGKTDSYTTTVKGKRVKFSHKGASALPPFSSVTSVSVIPFTDEGDIIAVKLRHRGFDIPGGHVEPGEDTPEQTMYREAAEEACITIRDPFLVEIIESDFFKSPSYMLLYGAKVHELHEFKVSDDEMSEGRVIVSPEKFIEQYEAGDKRLMKTAIEAAWKVLKK